MLNHSISVKRTYSTLDSVVDIASTSASVECYNKNWNIANEQ